MCWRATIMPAALGGVLVVVGWGCNDSDDGDGNGADMRECAYTAGEISAEQYDAGVRCDAGLAEIRPARFEHPCVPNENMCQADGCSTPPPYEPGWVQCSPCGNGSCECEFGENRCNCTPDCH